MDQSLPQIAVDKGLKLARALGAEITAVTGDAVLGLDRPAEAAMSFPVEEYVRATRDSAASDSSPVADAAKQAGVVMCLAP